MWDPPSCERLLYSCCIGVVNLTFSAKLYYVCNLENVRFTIPIQQLYNNYTTTPHMKVGPTGLLYSCCIGVVKESNPLQFYLVPRSLNG